MIKKIIKPLIITLTAFVALFVATGAYAGGYDLFMMPDAGKLNNPSTSVHMLYQMFGPLISDILNPSLPVSENGYLFAYMLKYWNFLIASGAGAFISYHLILAFVKSAENGKFLAGEAEKVGSILRYSLGGFFVAPVIGTGKFCAMQMLFMYGILSGVHAANLLWGTASYGIQMGVTPTIPSNLTSTINTVAGEMYLYDMVDKYTIGTIAKAHANGNCSGGDNSHAICITTGTTQAVDLENQPGFESVGNALIDEHSYHYLHNLSGVLRLYASKCASKKPLPNTTSGTSGVVNDPNCPAFDAWVLRHTVKHYEASTIKYSCNKDNCAGGASEKLVQGTGQCERTAHNIAISAGSVVCNGDTDCNDNFKQSFCTKHTPSGCPLYKENGGWSNISGKTVIVCTSQDSFVPAVSTGHAHSYTYTCAHGYKLSTWDGQYKVTQTGIEPGSGVCLPDMTSKQQYTKGEWVIDSGVDAINFHGPTSPESSGISIIDASDRLGSAKQEICHGNPLDIHSPKYFSCSAIGRDSSVCNKSYEVSQSGDYNCEFNGVHSDHCYPSESKCLPSSAGGVKTQYIAGFEKAVLMDSGTPSYQSESVIVSDGGVVKSQTQDGESHGENKKEAALIAPLGMNLGATPSDYGFPIVAQSGSPLYYGSGVGQRIACPATISHGVLAPPGQYYSTSTTSSICKYSCTSPWIPDGNGKCKAPPAPKCSTGKPGYCYGKQSICIAGLIGACIKHSTLYFKNKLAYNAIKDVCSIAPLGMLTPSCGAAVLGCKAASTCA